MDDFFTTFCAMTYLLSPIFYLSQLWPCSAYLKSRFVRFFFSIGTVFFSYNNSALAYFFSQFQPNERGLFV